MLLGYGPNMILSESMYDDRRRETGGIGADGSSAQTQQRRRGPTIARPATAPVRSTS